MEKPTSLIKIINEISEITNVSKKKIFNTMFKEGIINEYGFPTKKAFDEGYVGYSEESLN